MRKKKVAKSPKNWRKQRTKYGLLHLSKTSLVVIFIKQFYEKNDIRLWKNGSEETENKSYNFFQVSERNSGGRRPGRQHS